MRLLLFGAKGRMGQEVVRVAKEEEDVELFEVDMADCGTLEEAEEMTFDVILDFSHPDATPALLAFAKRKRVPIVIATTGHTDATREYITALANELPILLSENLSLGMQLFLRMASQLASFFADGNGEIVEMHRMGKVDQPSGTAKRLRQKILAETEGELDLPIHSLRMGDMPGTHTLLLGNNEETVSITHQAHSRRLYAKSGLRACRFLLGKSCGLYAMEDVVKQL